MEKIKIITDSACDISVDEEQSLGIEIMNFDIAVDGVNYVERKDFTVHEFYEMAAKAKNIPVTNQILVYRFADIYQRFYDEGYTDIVYVSINAKGSQTNGNAHFAKEKFFGKQPGLKDKFNIHIIDGGTYSYGYGYAVVQAAKKVAAGASLSEIIAFIEDWVANVRVICTAYSLEFAKKSGRINPVASFVGELLGLRPIIIFENGEAKIIDKVRGDQNVVPSLIKNAQSIMVPQTPYIVVKGCLEDKNAELLTACKKEFGYNPEAEIYVGGAITANIGPQAAAVIVKKKR